MTQWRRHFEAALAVSPILGSNHKEYMRHLREGRAQEAKIRQDIEVSDRLARAAAAERPLQKEN